MANRNAKDVQRFVDNISKEVGEKAYDPTEYATKEYVDETFEKKADVVDVVANPELSGDEADLTGLQVGDTKYKVPQGGGGVAKYLHSVSAQLRLGSTDIYFFGKYLSTSSTEQTDARSALSAIVGEKRCSGYAASVADGTWAELNGLYISNGTTKQIIGASYDIDNGFNILLFADGTAENVYGATSVNCEDDVQ